MRLMITFASQASVGLQNALLVEQAGHRLDDLQALGALAEMVARSSRTGTFPCRPSSAGGGAPADAGVLRLYAPVDRVDVYRRGERERGSREMEVAAARPGRPGGRGGEPGSGAARPCHADLVVRSRSLPDQPARGVLILMRAPQRPVFDGHERHLAATAANLLSVRLRKPYR